MPWAEAKDFVEHVKANGVKQFLAILRDHAGRSDPDFIWGDEQETMLVEVGPAPEDVRVLLAVHRALAVFKERSQGYAAHDACRSCGWRPEFGNHSIEGVAEPPFGGSLDEIGRVEASLAFRFKELAAVVPSLAQDGWRGAAVTLATFPLLGLPGCQAPAAAATPGRSDGVGSRSRFVPDEVITPHARFLTFVANIRNRKGVKVAAMLPMAADASGTVAAVGNELLVEQLPWVIQEQTVMKTTATINSGAAEQSPCVSDVDDPVPGYIYLDASAFGAGSCCTQVTFLGPSLSDARYLYDQMLVLAPLFLAITAASPFWRGRVAAVDTRAPAFAGTWDDRRFDELGGPRGSRAFSSPQLFIADSGPLNEAEAHYNNVAPTLHEASFRALQEAGTDERLAKHVAHLFARDPLTIFHERLELDNDEVGDHWENLQSTNWGTVRFKPPPARNANPEGKIGWRVELRTPEAQPTIFENAAVVCIARVMAELILRERWDLYTPVSLVEENLERSSSVNAATRSSFHFRTDFLSGSDGGQAAIAELPLREVLFGQDGRGLFERCEAFVRAEHARGACSAETSERFARYVDLFRRRVKGELPTPAAWLRQRLAKHQAYAGGSEVPRAFVREITEIFQDISGALPSDEAETMGRAASSAVGELLGDLWR